MNQEISTHTPLMQQYHDIKAEYADTLLMFQVGDFYELFYDDAKIAAAYLGIALTARGKNKGEPIPLCGVPVHAKDHYLTKLVKGGFKVALCDQMDKPRPGTVVRRGVTQVLTPGTLTDEALLDEKSASYLFSFFPMADSWGVVCGELLTGQLFATVLPAKSEKVLESELVRFFPDEIIMPRSSQAGTLPAHFKRLGYCVTTVDATPEQHNDAYVLWMQQQFKQSVVDAVVHQEAVHWALFYFYAYMRRNKEGALGQFRTLHLYKTDDFLQLDSATQRNLELVKNVHDGSSKNTLFSVIDCAITGMGSRMIKKWLLRPLIKKEAIIQRQDIIEYLVTHVAVAQELQGHMRQIGDIERVIGRIVLGCATIHDYRSLVSSLRVLPHVVHSICQAGEHYTLLSIIAQHMADFSPLVQFLSASINEDPLQPYLIKQGFDVHLDQVRDLVDNSNHKVLELEQAEQEKTGIASLKIRFNNVAGYYIEITKTRLDQVPDYYIRQQTLAGKERFTIPQLRILEGEIIRARAQIEQVERDIFTRIKQELTLYHTSLRKVAHALATVDALLGLSTVAYNNTYVRPTFDETARDCRIIAGRHPVVETQQGFRFVPNDTILTNGESFWIITGPNMGGKSTYLRQVALITILGQVGSFVPAQQAQLAIVDRVFTRIGAGDNLAEGKSTFLVEMEETAAICTQATPHSLVILDEVGRGTSTFDGLALAQAIVEHLVQHVKARCLFATHYHELTALQGQHHGIVSYYAASKKTSGGVVFLYMIVKGVADGSFGIQVAKLAGLPDQIVQRAGDLLYQLQAHEVSTKTSSPFPVNVSDEMLVLHKQIAELTALCSVQHKAVNMLQACDYDSLSPREAFNLVWDLKMLIEGAKEL